MADLLAMKPTQNKNYYVSHCKVCKLVVYVHDRWVWSRRPLGIVHADCVATGAAVTQ